MDFIEKSYPDYPWDDFMKKTFKNELLDKGFIKEDRNGNLLTTLEGKEFIRKGGYKNEKKKDIQENHLREKQLENINLDIELKKFSKKYTQKFAFVSIIILILNFIITIIINLYFQKN